MAKKVLKAIAVSAETQASFEKHGKAVLNEYEGAYGQNMNALVGFRMLKDVLAKHNVALPENEKDYAEFRADCQSLLKRVGNASANRQALTEKKTGTKAEAILEDQE